MMSRRKFLSAASVALGGLSAGCHRESSPAFSAIEGDSSAERAVRAARRFSGTTLNVGWESGLQTQELLQWSGPLWERLTGIQLNPVELGSPLDVFRRTFEEHRASTGELDCTLVVPACLPDLVAAGALEPLDRYVEHYMVEADLKDILPRYRTLGSWDGRCYGLFDDGDVLLLYYRKDLFEAKETQRAFAARYGRPLGDPRTYDWQQFVDAARFFTDRLGPRRYGLGPFNRDLRWGWFQALFRRNGGQFFDLKTMKPGLDGEPARKTMSALAELDRFMPPGTSDIAPKEALMSTYLSGAAAMASCWPPLGRWAEGYGLPAAQPGGLPRTQVAGETGYALLPGGVSEMAVGYLLSVLSRSQKKESAYLFVQWLTSPDISLDRVMLPYALRDPYRASHITSPAYRSRWKGASEYLDTLAAAEAEGALLDLIMPGYADYTEAFFIAATDVRLGVEVPVAIKRMAARWDAITDCHGRSSQRAAYAKYLKRRGATIREQTEP